MTTYLDNLVNTADTAAPDLLAGQTRLDEGRHEETLSTFARELLPLSSADDFALVDALTEQGEALRIAGRYDEAMRTLDRALDHATRCLGGDAPATAGVHNSMGVLRKATGDYAKALEHYLVALPVLLAHHGEHSETVATLYHNLGGINFVLGNMPEALHWACRGLHIRQEICRAEHITVTFDQAALVPILIQTGQYGQARALLDVVVPRLERDFGSDDYEVSVALTNLGALDAHEQRWEQARDNLLRAADIKRTALGPQHPELVTTLINLAVVAEHTGDAGLAASSNNEALRIAQASLSETHPLRRLLESDAP